MESANNMDRSYGNTTSDILILIVIAYFLFHALVIFLINIFSGGWWNHSIIRYIYTAFGIIGAAGPIVLGFAIRNKTLKIIGIIIGALYAIYAVFSNITQLIMFIKHY
jgi:hypothetical protein